MSRSAAKAQRAQLRPRPLTRADVIIKVGHEPEYLPVRGNVLASGDETADKLAEEETLARINEGDEWAWCMVRVTVRWGDFNHEVHLGGCSYLNEEEFRACPCFDDLVDEGLCELNEMIARNFDEIRSLLP